jgi:hypothetical protein
MSQIIINTGNADKGNGDPIRIAFTKVNDNFTELYTLLSSTTIDNNPPDAPSEGALWWDPVSGRLFISYNSNWVDASPVDGEGIPTTVAPEHSYGSAGDAAGMVAFDSTYIYYCTANYVNNSTNIWKRVALDATPW